MTKPFAKHALLGLAGFGLALAAQAAHAEVDPSYGGQGTDKFTLSAGWSFSNIDGSLGLNGTLQDGTPIDIGSGGSGKNTSSFSATGNWRVAKRHRVSLLYFRTKRENSVTLGKDVIIDDVTIPAGASATTDLTSNYYFGTYRYSFIKKDNLELAGVLGLYGSKVSFNFSASKYPGNPTATYATSQSTSLPLPVVGGSFDWYISPRWSANTSLSGLKAKIGDIDGSIWVLTASTDYMLFHNFGIGLAYLHTNINVDVSKKTFNGNFDYKSNSFMAYGVVKF